MCVCSHVCACHDPSMAVRQFGCQSSPSIFFEAGSHSLMCAAWLAGLKFPEIRLSPSLISPSWECWNLSCMWLLLASPIVRLWTRVLILVWEALCLQSHLPAITSLSLERLSGWTCLSVLLQHSSLWPHLQVLPSCPLPGVSDALWLDLRCAIYASQHPFRQCKTHSLDCLIISPISVEPPLSLSHYYYY